MLLGQDVGDSKQDPKDGVPQGWSCEAEASFYVKRIYFEGLERQIDLALSLTNESRDDIKDGVGLDTFCVVTAKLGRIGTFYGLALTAEQKVDVAIVISIARKKCMGLSRWYFDGELPPLF